jgi:hypothetical protein
MYPFRNLPDTIDGVICGRCSHPVWDHCTGDTCAQCDSHTPNIACSSFVLSGFAAAAASSVEASSPR